MFKGPPESGGRGGALFDDDARELLIAESRSGRDRARLIGDYTFYGGMIYPYTDPIVAWAVHGDADLAFQLFMLNSEAMSLTAFVSLGSQYFIGRARPSVENCERDPEWEVYCDDSLEYASFFSGHTAMATTGAALTCAHHINIPLYGAPAADALACGAAVTGALTTGLARIGADRHYATDVVVGWLVGAAIGIGVPVFGHYGRAQKRDGRAASSRSSFLVAPRLSTSAPQLGVVGLF